MKKITFILFLFFTPVFLFANQIDDCKSSLGNKFTNINSICNEKTVNTGLPTNLAAFYFNLEKAGYEGKVQINSGLRTGSGNADVGGANNSAHVVGQAVDVQVPEGWQEVFFRSAGGSGANFTRYGFKSRTGLHIDIRPGNDFWCYSGNEGSKRFCKEDDLVKLYTGSNTLFGHVVGKDTGIPVSGGVSGNDEEVSAELETICTSSDRDYGLVGFDSACADYWGQSGFDEFLSLIQRAINWAIGIIFLLAVLVIFYAGFVLLTANGQPAKRTQALSILKNVIIGLFFISAAWLLVDWIFNLFSVDDPSYKLISSLLKDIWIL